MKNMTLCLFLSHLFIVFVSDGHLYAQCPILPHRKQRLFDFERADLNCLYGRLCERLRTADFTYFAILVPVPGVRDLDLFGYLRALYIRFNACFAYLGNEMDRINLLNRRDERLRR